MVGVPAAATLVAVAYVLHAGFDAGVQPTTIVRPLLLTAAIGVALTTLLVAVCRSRELGGLVAVLAILGALGAGAAGTLVTRAHPVQTALWLALVAITLVLAIRVVRRLHQGRRLPRSSSVNVVSVLLLGIIAVQGLMGVRPPIPAAEPPDVPAASATGRDMLLVLLDGYPRADILQRYFAFDNRPFVDELAARGFEVSERAHANYAWTELTLLSMLHMEHATEIDVFTDLATRSESQPWLRELTAANPAFALARQAGYEIATIATNIDHVTLTSADTVITPPGPSDFESHLMRSTAVAGAIGMVDPDWFAGWQRSQVLWSFDTLTRLASTTGTGRLIVAHVLSPHMPAVFNADGSLRPVAFNESFHADFRALTDIAADDWRDAFVGQLEFVNTRTLAAVDRIIGANPDADVVVMSDHGTGMHYRPDHPRQLAEERYSTLFASRTPGIETPFSDDQTPVNVFPRWFNARLGTDLPDRPGTAYAGYLDLTPLSLDVSSR